MLCRPAAPLLPGQGVTLLSDLHIGSPLTDEALITADLNSALVRHDRILINGDIFDAILTADTKRFRPNAVAPWLHGVNDILGMALDRAESLLVPYAHLIDMIGLGNHEASLEKYHSLEPCSILVKRLQTRTKHSIFYGGYTGFVRYRLARTKQQEAKHRAGSSLTIFYWHGAGGGSSLSSALGEFGSKGGFVEGADVHWYAHKHVRLACPLERIRCSPAGTGPSRRTLWLVRTGAYMRAYEGQSQASWIKKGRVGNYAADTLLSPSAQGGMRLVLGPKGVADLRVEFTS